MEPDIMELLTSPFKKTPESRAFAETVQAGPGMLEILSPDVAGLGGLLVSGRHLLKGAGKALSGPAVDAFKALDRGTTAWINMMDGIMSGGRNARHPTALEAYEARKVDQEFDEIMEMIKFDRYFRSAEKLEGLTPRIDDAQIQLGSIEDLLRPPRRP